MDSDKENAKALQEASENAAEAGVAQNLDMSVEVWLESNKFGRLLKLPPP